MNNENYLSTDWKFYGYSRPMARDIIRQFKGSGSVEIKK